MNTKRVLLCVAFITVVCAVLVTVSCSEKAPESQPGEKEGGEITEMALPESAGDQQVAPPSPGKMQEGKAPESKAAETFLNKLSPQTVVAKVNGVEIKAWLVKEVGKIHRDQVKKQLGAVPPEMEEDLAQFAFDQAVKSELLYQEALREGVTADEKIIEDNVKSVKMSFPNEESFKEFLKVLGYGEDELRLETRKKLIINSYLTEKVMPLVRVSDQEARDHYDANKESFKAKELVRASYILFPFSEDTLEDRKVLLKEQAEKVLGELKSGGDFAELAKKYSKAPNADKGGDLGYFPRGRMVSNFEKIVFALPIGEISDVFETQFGYNIVRVTDKKPAGYMPFEEIKSYILERLMMQKIEEAISNKIEDLQKKSKIEVLIELPPLKEENAAIG